MFRAFVLTCLFCVLFAFSCEAQLSVTTPQKLTFGKLLLSSQNATATVSPASALVLDGAYVTGSNTASAGMLNFSTTESVTLKINLDSVNAVFSLDNGQNCSINVDNIALSDSVINLNNENTRKDVYLGAKLNITGYCTEKAYNGTITIPYTVTDENNVELNNSFPPAILDLTVEIEEPMAINKKSDLNFGTIFSPDQNGTVLISPNGDVTPTNVQMETSSNTSAGFVTITGISGRIVNLTTNSDTIELKNDNNDAMTVDNFIFSSGNSFTLGANGSALADQDVYIGATLHINAKQAQGTYVGSFTINAYY